MDLDPGAAAFVRRMRERNTPPFETLPVATARETYQRQSRHLGGEAVEMDAVVMTSVEGPAGPILLRLYRPHGLPAGPAPALVFYHGGGWTVGDFDSHDKICRQIAARTPCAVVAVAYRLAPEHPFPAAVEDAVAALTGVAAAAADLGIDAGRLAVGGDSAGGNLAAVAAIVARETGPALRGQVLVYPSTDNRLTGASYPSRARNAVVPPLTWDLVAHFHGLYLPDARHAEDWRASPICVPETTGLAPALVLTGERDVLCDEGERYADRLEAGGVQVQRHRFPGMIHGFLDVGGAIPAAATAFDLIAAWLRVRLSPAASARGSLG